MPTLPSQNGKADWTDYTDYWRELDAEWLRDRSVLRYDTEAVRSNATTGYTAPQTGMLSYLQTTTPAGGKLDLYTSGKWIPVIAAQNLTVAPITSSDNVEVTIGHKKMSGGGISSLLTTPRPTT